ncbi:MAG: redoxin domain-containing protein [Spirochaetaceae bacterium]|nr:redoxin domain-containing protein [Spirochaetaceae bacterium]
MSKIIAGSKAADFELPDLEGKSFHLSSLSGQRYHLAFFRFASCPFCNLRVNTLSRVAAAGRFGVIGKSGASFTIIAVFDSPLENLRRYAGRHEAPFPILADKGGVIHEEWGREISWLGAFKGMFGRFGTLMKSMFARGFLPTSLNGKFAGMPMGFLIDENGIVREAYYGTDEGDHMPIERIEAFASKSIQGINDTTG